MNHFRVIEKLVIPTVNFFYFFVMISKCFVMIMHGEIKKSKHKHRFRYKRYVYNKMDTVNKSE